MILPAFILICTFKIYQVLSSFVDGFTYEGHFSLQVFDTLFHDKTFWNSLWVTIKFNLICIPLAAGLFKVQMSPMIGAAAMSLSSFTVCMNALRLNLFNVHDDRFLVSLIHQKGSTGNTVHKFALVHSHSGLIV